MPLYGGGSVQLLPPTPPPMITMTTPLSTGLKHESALDLDSRHINSYATLANLQKAMARDGIDRFRHLIVRTPTGRWTCLILGFQQVLLNAGWAMVG